MNNILNVKLLDKHLLFPLILIILLFAIIAYSSERTNCSSFNNNQLNGNNQVTLHTNSNTQTSTHNSEKRG
jgi:hypothetical protein